MMMSRTVCLDISSYAGWYERNCSRVHELARLGVGPIVLEIVSIGRTPYYTGHRLKYGASKHKNLPRD